MFRGLRAVTFRRSRSQHQMLRRVEPKSRRVDHLRAFREVEAAATPREVIILCNQFECQGSRVVGASGDSYCCCFVVVNSVLLLIQLLYLSYPSPRHSDILTVALIRFRSHQIILSWPSTHPPLRNSIKRPVSLTKIRPPQSDSIRKSCRMTVSVGFPSILMRCCLQGS